MKNKDEIQCLMAQLKDVQLQQTMIINCLEAARDREARAEARRRFAMGDRVQITNPNRFQANRGSLVVSVRAESMQGHHQGVRSYSHRSISSSRMSETPVNTDSPVMQESVADGNTLGRSGRGCGLSGTTLAEAALMTSPVVPGTATSAEVAMMTSKSHVHHTATLAEVATMTHLKVQVLYFMTLLHRQQLQP
jgi:hypothetical protein